LRQPKEQVSVFTRAKKETNLLGMLGDQQQQQRRKGQCGREEAGSRIQLREQKLKELIRQRKLHA